MAAGCAVVDVTVVVGCAAAVEAVKGVMVFVADAGSVVAVVVTTAAPVGAVVAAAPPKPCPVAHASSSDATRATQQTRCI